MSAEPPRIGVFVCHCGSNIAGFLDVRAVADYARGLPGVVHAEDSLYACSQDAIGLISERVAEKDLNRVVVASCTPLTHAPLFKDSIRAAGLNPFLFEMANIRNQCSWVHSKDWEGATTKAKELVRMAVARVALLMPQHTVEVPVEHKALVIGGGPAGMTAALSLAEGGFPVHLVEKESVLGGNLRHIFTSGKGKDPGGTLSDLMERVGANDAITVHLESKVVASGGFSGNFTSQVQRADGAKQEIAHGAVILATGAQEYRGPEYGYGTDPRIVTQMEFERILTGKGQGIRDQEAIQNTQSAIEDQTPTTLNSIVMIQCVGPAERFCSRICCTVALKNALAVKEQAPEAQVILLYKDIRTYGFKEQLYTQARQRGVLFVRYDDEHRPQVDSRPGSALTIKAWDAILGRWLEVQPDLLVLSMPAVPRPESAELAALFKVPVDADGFFQEAHVKLRPVDFSTAGIYMAGMAHYPKLLDETMIQAQAAAARAARILSRDSLTAGGRVAVVDEHLCTGCLTCVRICPFGVPVIQPSLSGVGEIMGAAVIEPAICQGCGTCVAECPARAIQLIHYTDDQLRAEVRALVEPPEGFVPLVEVAGVDA